MEIIENKDIIINIKNEIEMYKNFLLQQKKGFIN